MAKITFEAGDVISFTENPSNDESFKNYYLGVCIDSKRCISFFKGSTSNDPEDSLFLNQGAIKDIPQTALPVSIDENVPPDWYQMFSALVLMAEVNSESNRDTKTCVVELVNAVHESIWLSLVQGATQVQELGRDGQDMRESGKIKKGAFVKIEPKSDKESTTLYFVDEHGWRLVSMST